MIDIGRICVKIAGRDAGKKCIVVDIIDDNYVLVDGETRRRKCNILHLEPLDKAVDIKKGASHAEVARAFEALGYGVHTPKTKQKAAARPKKARRSKLAGPAPTAVPATKKPLKAAAPQAEKKPAMPKKLVAEKSA